MKSNFRNFYNSKYIFIIFQCFLLYNCLRPTGSYIQILNSISDDCTQLQSVFQNSEEPLEDESLYNNMVAIGNIFKIHLKNYGSEINETARSVRAEALTEECKRTKHSKPLIKCHSTPESKIGTEVHSLVDKEKKLPNSNKNETKESLGSENPASKESSGNFVHEPKIKLKESGNNKHENSIEAELVHNDTFSEGKEFLYPKMNLQSREQHESTVEERNNEDLQSSSCTKEIRIKTLHKHEAFEQNKQKKTKDSPRSDSSTKIESFFSNAEKNTIKENENFETYVAQLVKLFYLYGEFHTIYSKILAEFDALYVDVRKDTPLYPKFFHVKNVLHQTNRYTLLNSIYIFFNSNFGLINFYYNDVRLSSSLSKLKKKIKRKNSGENDTQESKIPFDEDFKKRFIALRRDFLDHGYHLCLSKGFTTDLRKIFELMPEFCDEKTKDTILTIFGKLEIQLFKHLSNPAESGTIEKISNDVYEFENYEAFADLFYNLGLVFSGHITFFSTIVKFLEHLKINF